MVAGVFLAAPTAPPTPPQPQAPPRVGLRLSWVGWDGSVWQLNDPSSTVRLTRGTRGLGMPTGEHFTSSSPALAGARWRGWRATEREVVWHLWIYHRGDELEQLEQEHAFWRTMDPRRPGRFVAEAPDASSRSLGLRFVDDGAWAYQLDPLRFGWARYDVTLQAFEQPLWEGDPVVLAPLRNPLKVNFYGGGPVDEPGFGPPFVTTPSSTLQRASITNPGEHDAWPESVVVGPCSDALIGVGGRTIEVPFEVPEGKALVIDSSPEARWALQGSVQLDADGRLAVDGAGRVVVSDLAVPGSAGDRRRDLGAVRWAPVPPGTKVPLVARLTGAGAIQTALTPLYDRGF